MENNKKSTVICVIVTMIVTAMITFAGFYFIFLNPYIRYCDTHTWATLQVYGTVISETADAMEDSREFLKGDTYHLHNTVVTVEDITHSGNMTITFEPAVIDSDTGESIETMVIGKENVLNFQEVCNDGDSATWQFRVISNRYE